MDDNAQTPTSPIQPPAPVQPPPPQVTRPAQPQAISHHPEQPPMRVMDTQVVDEPETPTAQAASDTQDAPEEAQDTTIKESQPQLEISKELQEAGVEQGVDAEKENHPEEKKQLDVVVQNEPQVTVTDAAGVALPMSYADATQIQKTKGIRDSIRWLAKLIMYQWEKFQSKGGKDATNA